MRTATAVPFALPVCGSPGAAVSFCTTWAGDTQMSRVESTNSAGNRGWSPNRHSSREVLTKLTPYTVTAVPPATGPMDGYTDVRRMSGSKKNSVSAVVKS